MWKPNESLEDYNVEPAPQVTLKPPRAVSLYPTGQVETLKPLVQDAVPAATVYRFRSATLRQPMWFRRLLVTGSAALMITGLILLSAILVSLDDPAPRTDVATDQTPVDEPPETDNLALFDMFSPSSSTPPIAIRELARITTKRKAVKSRPWLNPRQSRRYAAPARPHEPKFIPTTLVIYSENGVVKTRIEPWVRSS